MTNLAQILGGAGPNTTSDAALAAAAGRSYGGYGGAPVSMMSQPLPNYANPQSYGSVSGLSGVTPEFNAQQYLAQNPDVAAAGMDPYQHYIQYGRAEGRAPGGQTIQTGLMGAESALIGGGEMAANAVQTGMGNARTDIMTARDRALSPISQGLAGVRTATQGGVNALTGSMDTVRGIAEGAKSDFASGMRGGLAGLTGATGLAQEYLAQGGQALTDMEARGMAQLDEIISQGADPLTGFVDPGRKAQALSAAYSGAMGPEAQAAAFKAFQESPDVAYQREEAERAIARNASAIGGLGGGNVRLELIRRATGEAQKSINDRIAQLNTIAGQGIQAATSAGALRGQQAQLATGLTSEAGRGLAGLKESGAGLEQALGQAGLQTEASIAEAGLGVDREIAQAELQSGVNVANLLQSGAMAEADLQSIASNIEQNTGINLADLSQQTGMSIADIVGTIAGGQAQLRTQAGRDLANAISTTTANLANLQADQGAGLSDITGQTGTQIANLLLNEGLIDSQTLQNMSTILANIATGGSAATANIASSIGDIQAAGIMGQNKAVQTAISSIFDSVGESGVLDKIFKRDQK